MSSADMGKSVVPVEDMVDVSAGEVPAIISPFLPRGDIITFAGKGGGKTALTMAMLLAWGYDLGHVVFVCPHVHKDKLKLQPGDKGYTKSVAKYKVLEGRKNITRVGMEGNTSEEAHEVLLEAFEVLDTKHQECDGQLVLVLDDMAAFMCYPPIKALLVREWVNLKHKGIWGW